jgi:hypothetical protein
MRKNHLTKNYSDKNQHRYKNNHPIATLFIGVMYSDEKLLYDVLDTLNKRFGAITSMTESYDFSEITKYYNKEMGSGIKKSIIVFGEIDVSSLPSIKRYTISLEKKYSVKDLRRINLDPGYVTITNVVLATTKNFTHRIYLNKGIFADLTLMFKKGKTVFFEWTYPDFRLKIVKDFFYAQRKKLLDKKHISDKAI